MSFFPRPTNLQMLMLTTLTTMLLMLIVYQKLMVGWRRNDGSYIIAQDLLRGKMIETQSDQPNIPAEPRPVDLTTVAADIQPPPPDHPLMRQFPVAPSQLNPVMNAPKRHDEILFHLTDHEVRLQMLESANARKH